MTKPPPSRRLCSATAANCRPDGFETILIDIDETIRGRREAWMKPAPRTFHGHGSERRYPLSWLAVKSKYWYRHFMTLTAAPCATLPDWSSANTSEQPAPAGITGNKPPG